MLEIHEQKDNSLMIFPQSSYLISINTEIGSYFYPATTRSLDVRIRKQNWTQKVSFFSVSNSLPTEFICLDRPYVHLPAQTRFMKLMPFLFQLIVEFKPYFECYLLQF